MENRLQTPLCLLRGSHFRFHKIGKAASFFRLPETIDPLVLTNMPLPPGLSVRKFELRDRGVIRFLCCQTGFLGKPIDPVFQDRELFADYLTSYYTDVEPESCFVLEQNGRVVGYLLGSRRPSRQQIHSFFQNIRLFVRGMSRY